MLERLRAIVAEEALARFVATDGAVTPAGEFIEAAAACDLIAAIDEVVLAGPHLLDSFS